MRLIVGLGNPGQEYEYTRHNLGFLVVRKLAKRMGLGFALSSMTNGLTADGSFDGEPLILLMPLTYMNNSGTAVRQVSEKKGIKPQDVLVVTDDFNLEFQQIRLRAKGSDGGHNGLNSVIERMGTDQFARLRMGIGRPPEGEDTVDYVLKPFDKKEKKALDPFIDQAVACCLTWVKEGASAAMDQYNKKS